MGRTFSTDIITLPRVDAHEAVTLASRVEAAAAAQTALPALPALVQASVTEISGIRALLQKALGGPTASTTPTKKEADRRVDTAAVALHTILTGWARLADFLPEGKAAEQVLSRVFEDGVDFVKAAYDREWALVDTKLKTIAAEGLTTPIAAVGASPVLTLLQQFHETYGLVLGKTPESPEVGKHRDALLVALRRLVVRVVGQVEDDKPATVAFADAILKPITEWESAKPAKSDKEGAEEPKEVTGADGTGRSVGGQGGAGTAPKPAAGGQGVGAATPTAGGAAQGGAPAAPAAGSATQGGGSSTPTAGGATQGGGSPTPTPGGGGGGAAPPA